MKLQEKPGRCARCGAPATILLHGSLYVARPKSEAAEHGPWGGIYGTDPEKPKPYTQLCRPCLVCPLDEDGNL
jgi:hypothetical protein